MIVAVLVLSALVAGQISDSLDEYDKTVAARLQLEEKVNFGLYDNLKLQKELARQEDEGALREYIARQELKMIYPDETVFLVKLP